MAYQASKFSLELREGQNSDCQKISFGPPFATFRTLRILEGGRHAARVGIQKAERTK